MPVWAVTEPKRRAQLAKHPVSMPLMVERYSKQETHQDNLILTHDQPQEHAFNVLKKN